MHVDTSLFLEESSISTKLYYSGVCISLQHPAKGSRLASVGPSGIQEPEEALRQLGAVWMEYNHKAQVRGTGSPLSK